MKRNRTFLFHLLAIATVTIWGTTFVSTKTLIHDGLTPTEIFVYRFALAYACILFVARSGLFAKSVFDEIKLMAAGITGGSLYFITENTALGLTQASNVAMLISVTPLLTTLIGLAVFKSERTRRPGRIIAGSLVALAGVAVILYNGNVVMQFNPKGDLLTLAAALSWALYSLLVKNLGSRYSITFISRKVFGYGLLSMAVWIPLFHPTAFNFRLLAQAEVVLNLLFLGIVASMLCFTAWSAVVRHIGMVKASNYINLNPIVTFISAYFILGERITTAALTGAIAVIIGVYLAERK